MNGIGWQSRCVTPASTAAEHQDMRFAGRMLTIRTDYTFIIPRNQTCESKHHGTRGSVDLFWVSRSWPSVFLGTTRTQDS